jgi:hypothetical protein
MKNTYKVVFVTYDELTVTARDDDEAKILAQAKIIESNRPYTIRWVERVNEYGKFEPVSVPRLIALK